LFFLITTTTQPTDTHNTQASAYHYFIIVLHSTKTQTLNLRQQQQRTMSDNKFLDDERFDGLYLNVANTARGIEPLLDTVFSFLRRKTDFFAGPPGSGDNGTELAIQKVNDVLQKHAQIYVKEKGKKQSSTKKPVPKKPKSEEEQVLEMGTDGGFDVSKLSATTAPTSPAAKAKTPDKLKAAPEQSVSPLPPAKTSSNTDPGDKKDEEDEHPVGNGGTVEGKYVWTQILSEVTVNIPVPENTRGRDLNVNIAKKHLKVGLKQTIEGKLTTKWLVDAPLTKPIIVEDSFWTVEDGNRLVIILQKSNAMEWWESVCQGDPKINLQKISPESSSLSDLDGEMRTTVEVRNLRYC